MIYFDALDYTNDLESLAALICNCDLIVSIGSFTASFAGALGKKVWVLISFISVITISFFAYKIFPIEKFKIIYPLLIFFS